MSSNFQQKTDTVTQMPTLSIRNQSIFLCFPGSLEHYTTAEPRKHRRISLAGDIVLTLKHRTDTESGLLSPQFWQQF